MFSKKTNNNVRVLVVKLRLQNLESSTRPKENNLCDLNLSRKIKE